MPFQQITVIEFKKMKEEQEIIVIDIRDPNSYEAGHIEDAIHVQQANIEKFIEEADKEKPLVVCCYHGNSSQGAAEFLNQRGFKNAYSLEGGFAAYEESQ